MTLAAHDNPAEKPTPKATACAEITIMGIRLRCYVLDDRRRVFDSDDIAKFFAALEDESHPRMTDAEAVNLARVANGRAEFFKPI